VSRLLALVLLLASALPLGAQQLVTGLSTERIALTADFNGSEILIFGAIRRDSSPPEGAGPLDIIITIKGPARAVTVRRKERRFGIWVNTDSVVVRQAPSFYAIATTRPIADLLSQTERLRFGIGMDQAVRRIGGTMLADPVPFTEALIRLKVRDGAYQLLDGDVSVAEETLFQTRIEMPANLVEGTYLAEFFLVRDREVVSAGETSITVEKTGIERWIYNLSRHEPLLYGLMSVALAIAAGWLAAAAFRLGGR
jgi:uncharacterized protein (TIGR02186 family)